MEYFIIIALQTLGFGFNAGLKIRELDKKYEGDTLQEVISEFAKSDRITIIISGLVLLLNLLIHYIVNTYTPQLRETVVSIPLTDIQVPYIIAAFIAAFFLGYLGQWLLYKVFGKAEDALNKKFEVKTS